MTQTASILVTGMMVLTLLPLRNKNQRNQRATAIPL